MDISFSRLHKYETCGAAYGYHYVRGLRTEHTSANFVIGRAFDRAGSEFVKAHALGKTVDPVRVFEAEWERQLDENIIEFSATQSPEALRATGIVLSEQFPAFWEESGLTALIGPGGEPMVQQKLTYELMPGVRMRGWLDLVAMTAEGEVAILDLKTARTPAPEAILLLGEQLTDYQTLVEENAERLGIEGVDKLGFIEGFKRNVPKKGLRGKGPEIVCSALVPPRSRELVRERRQKVAWLVSQIRAGAFFRQPRMAYDSPCELCEFKNLCLHGSMEGLVDPKAAQPALV